MVELGSRRLQLQSLPVGQPDPVPKRSWTKAKTHGRANARALTANELAERRQRQEARVQGQDLTTSVTAVRPSTPEKPAIALPIRTPTTAERSRPRRTPSPEPPSPSVSEFEPPASTAPSRIGTDKRKRTQTKKYQEAKATGLLPESQPRN